MSCFERRGRSGKPEVPERLLRLDRELKTEKTKNTDRVWAVREGEYGQKFRFKISFVRISANCFTATTTVNGRVHRRTADTPSVAYIQLVKTLSIIASRMTFDANLSKNLNSMVPA